jgi:hypothetical protein
VPALLGAAETSKGDVLATAVVLMAVRFLDELRRSRDASLLADVLACALLATGLRLSSLPWLAVLFMAVLAFWAPLLMRQPAAAFAWLRGRAGALSLLALTAAVLVHSRTFELTGTPVVTNASTQHSLDAIGWRLRFPIGTLTGGEAPVGVRGLLDIVNFAIAPSAYRFHVVKWMGAVWLAAAAAALIRLALVRGRAAWLREHGVLLALGLAFALVVCINSWPVRGGDGNYFLVPVACLAVAGVAAVRGGRAMDLSLVACAAIGTAIYLLTSNWAVGIETVPRTLARTPFDARAQVGAYLSKDNLTYVANYLQKCNPHTRVTGLLPDTGSAFALPARYEPLQEMDWNNATSFNSTSAFERLLKAAGTQLLVLPASDRLPHVVRQPRLYAFARDAAQSMLADGRAVEQTRRGDYVLYRLTGAAPLRGCPQR